MDQMYFERKMKISFKILYNQAYCYVILKSWNHLGECSLGIHIKLENIHSNFHWLVVNCDVVWNIRGPSSIMTLVNKWGTALWSRGVPSPLLRSPFPILLFLHATKITGGWNLELAVDLDVGSGVAWCKRGGKPWQNWLITENTASCI